jgi:hypothetical protein
MTTLNDLIKNIDFNNKKLESTPDWEELARIFNVLDLYWSDDTRLKAYFIKTWYCTDSWVGIRAYFLDGEFVALSNQSGRKGDEDFEFVNKESAKKVEDYLRSLVVENRVEPYFDILEGLDDEIPSTYKIQYNTQILHKTALLNGEKVEIVKTNYESEGIKSPNYFYTVMIKHSNGKKEEINCKELDFEYNTID